MTTVQENTRHAPVASPGPAAVTSPAVQDCGYGR